MQVKAKIEGGMSDIDMIADYDRIRGMDHSTLRDETPLAMGI